jgi:DNA-binding transcriptional MocR family regulator
VLTEILPARLGTQGIPVKAGDLVIGTSAQQFISLATDVVNRLGGPREAVFAVGQPGYYTIFDAWDHADVRMIGIETDEDGARATATS